MNAMNQWAAALDGAHIPGGCDTCPAYQTADVVDRGVTLVTVHYDDACATYRSMHPRWQRRARR